MKVKLLISFWFFFAFVFTGHAQSLYQFRYNLPQATDTTTYNALLVLYPEGSGFVRIRYGSRVNGEEVLNQFDVQEQYNDLIDAKTRIDQVFYKLSNFKLIRGNYRSSASLPFFSFRKNINTGEFEPYGVTTSITDTGQMVKKFLKVEYIDSSMLKEELVLQYFNRSEDFYKSITRGNTKGVSPFDKNTNLILFTVANTNDPEIGASCLKDKDRMEETFAKIADYLGLKFQPISIWGAKYNKANVQKEINNLKPLKNDVVVFYYSGHGFRKDSDSRYFPYIDLRSKPDKTYMINSLNMEDIYNSIVKKGARLNLVLSDCCNRKVGDRNATGASITTKKGFGTSWSWANCQALFLNPKPTSILATAAGIGELASSNGEFGGFFSYFFKIAMESQFSFLKMDPSWDRILQETQKLTTNKALRTYCAKPYIPENICFQRPIWK